MHRKRLSKEERADAVRSELLSRRCIVLERCWGGNKRRRPGHVCSAEAAPYIVIHGANLASVQVWALPTGTGMDDYKTLCVPGATP